MTPVIEGIIERKYTDKSGASVLDVDDSKKMVKIAIASTSEVDRDDDIFDAKAFNNTIMQKGPKGSNEVWHLLDHGGGIKSAALSKPKELYMDGTKLVMVSSYRNTFNWRDVAWPLYEGKDINQHSVGFSTVNSAHDTKDGKPIRVITEASLWEGSAVLWGANPNTATMDVVKNWLAGVEKRSHEAIGDRFNRIYKGIKDGDYTEENASLLKIEFKYLEGYVLELEHKAALQPAENAIETAAKEAEAKQLHSVLEAINNFNQQF